MWCVFFIDGQGAGSFVGMRDTEQQASEVRKQSALDEGIGPEKYTFWYQITFVEKNTVRKVY